MHQRPRERLIALVLRQLDEEAGGEWSPLGPVAGGADGQGDLLRDCPLAFQQQEGQMGDLPRQIAQCLARALPCRRRSIRKLPPPDQIIGHVGQDNLVQVQAQGVADLIPVFHGAIRGGGVAISTAGRIGCAQCRMDRREAAVGVRLGGGASPARDRALVVQDALALRLGFGVAPGEGELTRQRAAITVRISGVPQGDSQGG